MLVRPDRSITIRTCFGFVCSRPVWSRSSRISFCCKLLPSEFVYDHPQISVSTVAWSTCHLLKAKNALPPCIARARADDNSGKTMQHHPNYRQKGSTIALNPQRSVLFVLPHEPIFSLYCWYSHISSVAMFSAGLELTFSFSVCEVKRICVISCGHLSYVNTTQVRSHGHLWKGPGHCASSRSH